MNKTGRTEHALGLLLCKSRCVCDRAPRIEGSGLLFFMFISVRPGFPGSSDGCFCVRFVFSFAS